MRKIFKLLGFLSAILCLFFVVAILAFYYLTRVGELRRYLVDEIEKQTELKAQVGGADIEIGWITGVVFQNVALTEADAAQPAITAARVTARVALRPLLRRQVIFYEIRLTRPTLRLVRDPAGRFPLLDKLLNLPFLKQQNSEFSFDLHSLKVDGGDFEVTDQAPSGGEKKWRLVDAKLELDHVRGQRLRDFFQSLFKQQPAESGAGLEFDLKSAVIKDGSKMNLNARGYLVFPRATFDLREARWNADLELVNLPATLVKDYVNARVPIKHMSGLLTQHLRVQGSPAEQLHINGDVEFRQLAVDAPEFFLAPLAGADGRVSFDVDWSERLLQIRHADFRANDLKFSLQGNISALDGNDPRLRLNLGSLSAPVAALRRYLPIKIVESAPLEKMLDSIQAGQLEVKKAGIDATLSQLRRLARTGLGQQVWFDAELRDFAAASPMENALLLRGVSGWLSLANGVLAFKNIQAAYGDARWSDINGTYDLSAANAGKLTLQARGDVNLAELKEQVRSGGIAPPADKFIASLQQLSGRSKIDLALERSPQEPLQFDGKMTLDNARLRYDEYAFSELQGDLAVTAKEIKAEIIRAQLNGSPIQIQLALKDYDSDAGTFDLGIESGGMRAGVVSHLLLETGDLRDPGVVRGALRYAGSLADKSRRKLTGNLDLFNVQLRIHPLLQPLRELNGRIKIDDSGIDFQNIRASLVGFPAGASGRWRFSGKPQLLFDFAAPDLDITYLISQIDPELLGDFYANLVAEGKIALNKGRIKNFDFNDVKTNVTIDRRAWRLTNLTASSAGGAIQGVTTIFDKPDTLGVVSNPQIQGVPIQSFLHWFGVTTAEMTGQVHLTGKLETVGRNDTERKQNLNGAFNLRIADGTIHRMRVLVQILNLLDLSRWFTLQLPDLTKQGIRFRSITGDFKVTKGVYSTENFIVDSSDLRMTGIGKIDVPKDEVDFIVAVRPFAGIDSAMSYIPVLGRSIAAIKNSFLVASFHITGRIDDPTITPAPLGTLSEWFWGVLGIPKNIIGFGEGEQRQEPPKEPASAPSK